MYGEVIIDGKKYIERLQVFPFQLIVTVGLSLVQNLRLTLPGVAPFVAKYLTRETIAAGVPAVRRFKFKFGITDGGINYTSAGVGGINDRVLDSLIFGSGQFPYVVAPNILISPSGSFTYEVEDLSNNVPYTIEMALHGSFLIPA